MKLELCKNVILKITGAVTGKQYVFPGAGSIVDVDEEDAEIMLTKKSGHPCCTGGSPTPYFRKVAEPLPEQTIGDEHLPKKSSKVMTSARRA